MNKKKIIIDSLSNTKRYMLIIPALSAVITYLKLQIPMCIKYGIDGIAFGNNSVIPDFLTRWFRNRTNAKHISTFNVPIATLFMHFRNFLYT